MSPTRPSQTRARDDHVEVFTLPVGGLSTKPVFDEFDVPTYAAVLGAALNQPVEDIFDGERILSLIHEVDKPRTLPWSADEWVPVAIA